MTLMWTDLCGHYRGLAAGWQLVSTARQMMRSPVNTDKVIVVTTLQLLLIAASLGAIPASKLVHALVKLLFELVAGVVIVFLLIVLTAIASHGKLV